jgi:hypothetical protein
LSIRECRAYRGSCWRSRTFGEVGHIRTNMRPAANHASTDALGATHRNEPSPETPHDPRDGLSRSPPAQEPSARSPPSSPRART